MIKEAWKSITLAIVFVAAASFVLSWQYNKIENRSEEKLSSLEDIIEQGLAQDVLDKFMTARIAKNESQANIYLTERAMEEKGREEFVLIDDFESYFVVKNEKLPPLSEQEQKRYKFTVKVYENDEVGEIVETITLTKIIDKYYVDSVEVAG